MAKKTVTQQSSNWTFLSNHTHILVCISRQDDLRIRDIADQVGITERAVSVIINDLVEAGYLKRSRSGRRNFYTINRKGKLRHELEANTTIDKLLTLFK